MDLVFERTVFRLLFGTAQDRIDRGHGWQAEYMIGRVRDAGRAFGAVTELFIDEMSSADDALAQRLAPLLREIS